MPKKKTKFGKIKAVYLSNESIEKAKQMSLNLSSFVDLKIIEAYDAQEKRRALQEENF